MDAVAAATAPAGSKRKVGDAGPSTDTAGTMKKKTKSSISADTVKPVTSAGGQLKVGDSLPAGLRLTTQSGKEVDVSSLRKAVLFSYPRANTSGCTTQAKAYKTDFDHFTAAKYTVYGLSNDSPTSLRSWKEKQGFPFHLLSDPHRKLIHALTGSNDKTRRSHFVIDSDGKLAHIAISVKPPDVSPLSVPS